MILPFLLATTFDFPGGTAPELAKAALAATQKPVAIMGDRETKLRAAKFQWEGDPDFAQEMRSFFSFRLMTEEERKAGTSGFGTVWPVSMVAPQSRVRTGTAGGLRGRAGGFNPTPTPPAASRATPPIEAKPVPEGVSFGPATQFANGPLNWFLQQVEMAVATGDAKPEEVRNTVLTALAADAMGEPRWSEFRARYVGGLNEALRIARSRATNTRDPILLSLSIKTAAVSAMKDADLQQAFASQGSSVTIQGNRGSAIYQGGWNMLSLMANPQTGGARNARETMREARNIDPRLPVVLTFTSPATFSLNMGGQGNTVNIPLP
ncbi:hypothetical protein BH11ARM2_BH11ARM2_04930 [soil metagenome]